MDNLIFSEDIDSFSSVSDINAIEYIYIDDEPYFISENGNIYKLNGGRTSTGDSSIRFIVNDNYQYTKAFDNVELFFSTNNNSVVSSASFNTESQSSLTATSSDFDKREDTHKLSIPRASDDFFAERMRGKYISSEYIINKDSENEYFFSLPYIKTKYRYSVI